MRWMDGENALELTCRRAVGGVVLLRCETRDASVRLPDTVDGAPVTGLGDYAMARRAPDLSPFSDAFRVRVGAGYAGSHDAAVIRHLILPRAARSIGNCAFFDCHALESLDAGCELEEIGSGAFLNCTRFRLLCAGVSPGGTSCLRSVLREHHGELLCTLHFADGGQARLWFPAYSEEYEELAAPHIFGYHIEGAGFTYRQCFDGKRLNFAQYDAALEYLVRAQDVDDAVRVALVRLRWPRELSPAHRAQYEALVSTHADAALRLLLTERDSEGLACLLRLGLFPRRALERACDDARAGRNTEMLGQLLEQLHRAGAERPAKTFDL